MASILSVAPAAATRSIACTSSASTSSIGETRSRFALSTGTSSASGRTAVSLLAKNAASRRVVVNASNGDTFASDYDNEITPDVIVGPSLPITDIKDISSDLEKDSSVSDAFKEAVKDAKEAGSGTADLKRGLIDALYGTMRGLRVSSESRAEIVELITQLEAENPTTAPTEAADLLNGKWVLAYTSFSELYPILAAGNLPFVKVGEISQTINTNAQLLSNTVTFESPVSTSTFVAEASFEVRSPMRLQIKFEEGVIGSPEVVSSGVPSSVDVFGQRVDLTQFEPLLRPLQNTASSIVQFLSGQPPLKFKLPGGERSTSWLLTTYLDEDLRISRGDGGGLFVLLKAESPLGMYL